MIKKGSKVKVKDNLERELKKLGICNITAKITHNKYVNTEQMIHDICENNQIVTIDFLVDIPITACQKL
jgi:hypothetical protein